MKRILTIGLAILLMVNCQESFSEKEINLEPIKHILNGQILGDSISYTHKKIDETNLSVDIFINRQNNLIQEVDIHFKSLPDSAYFDLLEYYNAQFNSSYTDSVFNSWHTDSSEFILFKNSDSSILVNIFKRTHL